MQVTFRSVISLWNTFRYGVHLMKQRKIVVSSYCYISTVVFISNFNYCEASEISASCEVISRSFRTESLTKYTLTFCITRWEATQRVMAANLTRLTHKIAIQLHLVAKSCTIWSSLSRRPVRILLNTPSYLLSIKYVVDFSTQWFLFLMFIFSRSQWPRGLRQVLPSPARTLGSLVRILLGAWMCVCVSLCCVVLCR
jgi:hypothetical protein